jgi:hypothetical protein
MPVRPLGVDGRRGLTVLGITLTRTQTLIGLAIVLALVVGLIVILPLAFGDDDKPGDKAAQRPPATAGATPTPTRAEPTRTASARPTQKPTTAPPSQPPATGSVALPAGWKMYRDPTGFTVPIPANADIKPRGSEVYIQANNRLLIVDQTDQPQPDPVADWQRQERARKGSQYRAYQRIKIVPVDFWTKAADWEFIYTTSSGNRQHAVKRGVITGPKQAYGLSWYTSPEDWAAGLKDLQLIYQGFQPRK